MDFRFYSNAVSQASRMAAAGIFIVGLMLIGFGLIIFALPELFAALAALLFSFVGLGCLVTAVKIFLMQRKMNKFDSDDSTQDYRKNVRIHTEEHNDL